MAEKRTLGPSSDIPLGEGRTYTVDGHEFAVFRTRTGQLFATQARCPHKGGPLSDGLLGPKSLICPLHEWHFDLATGSAIHGECGIQVYAISEDPEGMMTLALDKPSSA